MLDRITHQTESVLYRFDRLHHLFLWILPAIAALPLLTAATPIQYRATREVAGYFQTLSFVRDGFGAFTYITPRESFSALHLHSLLNTPFVALGYPSGMRLINFVIAIGVVVLVGSFVARHYGYLAGTITAFSLWAHPLFLRFSFGYLPEALSILLTAGAAIAMYQFAQTDENRWYLASVGLLAVAMTNHMWEATVALPLSALCLYARRYRHAVGVPLVVATMFALIWYIRRIYGPVESGQLLGYSVLKTGLTVYARPEWWLSHFSWHPIHIAFTLTLPASILAFAYWTNRTRHDQTAWNVLLSSWLASGITLIVLLPHGFAGHDYYLWALLAPLAMTVGVVVTEDLASVLPSVSTRQVALGLAGLLLVAAVTNGWLLEAAVLGGTGLPVVSSPDGQVQPSNNLTHEQTINAGLEISDSEIETVSEVTFVGDWEQNYYSSVGRVLIYSGHLVKGWEDPRNAGHDYHGDYSPRFAQSPDEANDCKLMVIHTGDDIIVSECKS